MEHNENDIDLLLAEAHELIAEPAQDPVPTEDNPKKKSVGRTILRILGRFLCVLLETVLLVAVALYGVMFVLAKGPSPTARDIFVLSVRETSAVGFLANLFFTDEEIALVIDSFSDELLASMMGKLLLTQSVPEILGVLKTDRAHEDYNPSVRENHDQIDFIRHWDHSRSRVGQMFCFDDMVQVDFDLLKQYDPDGFKDFEKTKSKYMEI